MENLVISLDELKENNEKIKLLLSKMNNYTITEQEYQDLQKLLIWHYALQDILIYYNCIKTGDEFYNGAYPVCHTQVDGEKLLFISDTHLGHKKENIDFVLEAYNCALKNGIKTVVHAGDLIEGTARNYKEINKLDYSRRFELLQNEIKRAINILPREIKTKLLLGNHDYLALRTCPRLVPSFFGYENLDILGLGCALINWNSSVTLEISHTINDSLFSKTMEEDTLKIKGHSHVYSTDCNNKTIWLPTLSVDSREISSDLSGWGISFSEIKNKALPVFVIAEKVDAEIVLFREYLKFESEEAKINEEVEYDLKTKKMQMVRRRYR